MLPGTRLGPYEIIESIGHGGMGEVYRARDTRLQRQVAIKTLASDAPADPHFHERFDREARAVAALSHPNILAIHDVGSHDGIPYVAVELLEGETLRSRIGASPLPLSTVARLRGADRPRPRRRARSRHRPSRSQAGEHLRHPRRPDEAARFRTRDRTRRRSRETSPTRPPQTERGMLLGTAGYMSPEQARGERDRRALGHLLVRLRAVRDGVRPARVHGRQPDRNAPRDSERASAGSRRASARDVPPTLDRVIRRCLEKAPESRFQTARDLVFALESLADGSDGGRRRRSPASAAIAPTDGRPPAIARRGRRRGRGALWWGIPRNRPAEAAAAAQPGRRARRRLLAVLPFENISRGGEGTSRPA